MRRGGRRTKRRGELGDATRFTGDAFRVLVLLALVPGLLAVATIVVGPRDVPRASTGGSASGSG
jgi:hypothetical protein